MTNDIRAKEWQRSHYALRTALNDILSTGNNSEIANDVLRLRDRFLAKSRESAKEVKSGVATMLETTRREEFAHVFKLSIDLVRFKASAQANRVVADELTAVLEASGRNAKAGQSPSDADSLQSPAEVVGDVLLAQDRMVAQGGGGAVRTNVISLKDRFRRDKRRF